MSCGSEVLHATRGLGGQAALQQLGEAEVEEPVERRPCGGVEVELRHAVTSPDATAWTSRPPGTGSFLSAVAWTGQELSAVGQAGTMLASPDGGSWLPRQSGTAEDLRGVASSGAVLVAVGSGGTILSSP